MTTMAPYGQRTPKADPEYSRALVRAAVVEAAFFAIGVVAWFVTQDLVWLLVPVGMGMVAFMAMFLPAYRAFGERKAAERGQPSIVEDPHGRF